MTHYLEAKVLEFLRGLAGDVKTRRDACAAAGFRRPSATGERRRRLGRELPRAEDAIARLAIQNAQRPWPPAVSDASRDALGEQIARLTMALEEAAATRGR